MQKFCYHQTKGKKDSTFICSFSSSEQETVVCPYSPNDIRSFEGRMIMAKEELKCLDFMPLAD